MNEDHQKKSPRNLCEACRHAGRCPLREESTGPIVCCDWFAVSTRDREREDDGATVSIIEAPPTDPFRQGEGLCATCANRSICPRSAVEGGVWRCKDYC